MSSAISVRLDSEALRALAQLESTGLSRSEAIRKAILDSAGRLRRRAALAAEVAALEADEDDRREMLEVAEFMESMPAAGLHSRVPPHHGARATSNAVGVTG
jgi:Arc/MetJ-type ribon-helix-helix transcriptional regulator